MYQAFFGLREKPFNLTPDPKFLYLNSSYREALASLHYAIAERKGFATLVGEAGTGKTTLLRRLLSELPRDTRSVLVINPAVGFDELLRFILTDLGRPPEPGTSKLEMTEALNAELLDTLARGGNVVVFIDEAQDLTIPVLEELRLLSNLETAKEKILQLVLAGQPEFESMLSRPEIRQLRQRIAVNARLRPLGRREVKEYVAARIAAAGGDERGLFRSDALHRLWRFSRGVPRLVNVACDNALVTAYAAGRRTVGWKAMGEAVRDLAPAQRVQGRVAASVFRLGTIAAAMVVGAGGAYAVSRLASEPVVEPRAMVAAPVVSPVPATPASVQLARPAKPIGSDVGMERERMSLQGGSVAVPDESRPRVQQAAASPVGTARADTAPGVEVVEPPTSDTPGRVARNLELQDEVVEPVVPDTPGVVAGDLESQDAVQPTDEAVVSPGDEPSRAALPVASSEPAAESNVPTGDRYVKVARGDTLTTIAQEHYGYVSEGLLRAIKVANPSLADIDVILVGGTLLLPSPDQIADRPR